MNKVEAAFPADEPGAETLDSDIVVPAVCEEIAPLLARINTIDLAAVLRGAPIGQEQRLVWGPSVELWHHQVHLHAPGDQLRYQVNHVFAQAAHKLRPKLPRQHQHL